VGRYGFSMRDWVLARKRTVIAVWCLLLLPAWAAVFVNSTVGAVLVVGLAILGVVLWGWINRDSDHPTDFPPPGAST
jgi:hypothetical protein